jgi:putative nucleotidyltransferase with HDIG domain
MNSRKQEGVSPLQAFFFAVALSAALIVVLAPVLPGEVSLQPGDIAYKTFEADGTVIAEEGASLSAAQISRIREAGLNENQFSAAGLVAVALIGILGGGFMGIYLYLFRPREVNTVPRLFMVGMLVVFWVFAAKVFLSLTLPDTDRMYLAYILPIAAAPMLISTLLDSGLAIVTAVLVSVLAVFSGFYMPHVHEPLTVGPLEGLQMAVAFMLASMAGIFGMRRAERVNRYLGAGVMVALVTFAVLLSFWLLTPGRQAVDLVWMLGAPALGGLASAVITLGATVILGLIFGVTTRIQLMELAQLSHPLLRQLQEKAPGTFHHSVIVGNLAERAADLVGADPLLVRAGCYFHDIGKIAKPSYYIENQSEGENPHDRLQAHVSARLVAEHVRLGLELASKHRVPARVRAFIPEHHGTRLVTFFYRKAAESDPTIDPDKFRYPGPKPQTRETAIVMLADSVEAVVRASKDRSYEKIDQLVDSVISERVQEGQLDECDLTLRDLKIIGESFKATLRGIYHPRIEYPAPTKAELQAAGGGVGYVKPPMDSSQLEESRT